MAETHYSPRLRTAVVLCGAGTAGIYEAGVLRALSEAGVITGTPARAGTYNFLLRVGGPASSDVQPGTRSFKRRFVRRGKASPAISM